MGPAEAGSAVPICFEAGCRLARARTFEITQDRAVRPVIAITSGRQLLDGMAHGGQFGDLRFDPGQMIEGEQLDVSAGAPLVLPKIKQPPDALD